MVHGNGTFRSISSSVYRANPCSERCLNPFSDSFGRALLGSSAIKLSLWGRLNRIGKGIKLRADDGRERRTNMGKVRTGHSTSLDGFIAGPNDGPEAPLGDGGERLLAWYSGGDTEYRLPSTEMVFKVSPLSAELLRETRRTTGALVTGRQTPLRRTGLCCYPYRPTRSGFPKDRRSR